MSPKIYRRHEVGCKNTERAQKDCDCVIWIGWFHQGKNIRKSLKTRNWSIAEKQATEMEILGINRCLRPLAKHDRSREKDWADKREAAIAQQNGRCAICQTADPGTKGWYLDHDHVTGEIRQALCSYCNSLLGFAKDSEDILLNAIIYLRKHKKASQDAALEETAA